jgi:hypothetical protein
VLSREGFATMPAFALAVRAADGRTNVAVRGSVEVVAVCADGTFTVEGVGVSTWVERVLNDVQQLRFTVAGEQSKGALPLVAGVVRAGGLVTPADEDADLTATEGADEDESLDAGEPVVEPVVEPFDARVPDLAVVEVTAPPQVAQVEPVAVEPVALEPVAVEPVALEPVVEPVAVEPVAEPVAVEPVVEPVAVEPVVEPVASEPVPQVEASVAEGPAPDPLGADLLRAGGDELSALPDADREPVSVGAHTLTDGGGGSDGAAFTILSSSLADLREGLPVWRGAAPVPEPEPLPAPSRTSARLVLSTGLVVALDRPVLLGRAPQAVRVSGRELPRLVAVPSPQQDISRTHAEVRVEGEEVLVTDLDSTNGVHVLQPGRGARRLRPGEPRSVRADETIDLGDGVTFIVERGT